MTTSELVPWRGANVPLLGQGEVSRSSLAEWFQWAMSSANQYMGPPAPVTLYGNRPAEPISNSFEGFVQGMLYSDGPVAAVENYRLGVFGQAPLLFQEFLDGRPGDFFDDPALDRLRTPWPGGTLSDLAKRLLMFGDMAGNAFVVDMDDELVLLRPDWVEIVLEKRMHRGGQVGWRQVGIVYYEGGLRSNDGVAFLPGEYCHFVPGLPDPLATYRGMSWLTPLVREVKADKSAGDHKVAWFENAASVNVAVSLPKEITPGQFIEFVEKMDAQHKGAQNAGKTLYTGGGADVTVIGANMQQADFASIVGKGENRIANAGRVPAVLLGFSEGLGGSSLNAGNYTAAKRNFVDTTMRDLWGNFAGSLQQMDAFTPPRERSRLWYDGRDIPFLHEDAMDAANIQKTVASTITMLVREGFTADSSKLATVHQDMTLLEHTGLTSVQLQPPGSQDANGDGVPDGEAQAADEYQQALDEFRADLVPLWDEIARAEELGEDWIERKYYDVRVDAGHVGGGRFRKIGSVAAALLNDWLDGKGDSEDPLDQFEQPQLKKIAEQLGIATPPRAGKAKLKLAILEDAKQRHRDVHEGPKPRASFTLKGGAGKEGVAPLSAETRARLAKELHFQAELFKGAVDATDRETSDQLFELAAGVRTGSIPDAQVSDRLAALAKHYDGQVTQDNLRQWSRAFDRKGRGVLRDLDVGVYVENKPNSRIFLRRESNGKPGRTLESFDDLDAMAAWADEHGETELAGWALKERDGSKPVKKAASPTSSPVDGAVAALEAASTKAEGRAALSGLTMKQIDEVYERLGFAPEGTNKQGRIERLLAHTVGARNLSKAVEDADKKAPSKLDLDPRERETENADLVHAYRALRNSMLHEKDHDLSDASDEDLEDLRAHIEADPRRDRLYDKSIAAIKAELKSRGVPSNPAPRKAAKKAADSTAEHLAHQQIGHDITPFGEPVAPSKAPVKRVPGKKAAPKADAAPADTSRPVREYGSEAEAMALTPVERAAIRRARNRLDAARTPEAKREAVAGLHGAPLRELAASRWIDPQGLSDDDLADRIAHSVTTPDILEGINPSRHEGGTEEIHRLAAERIAQTWDISAADMDVLLREDKKTSLLGRPLEEQKRAWLQAALANYDSGAYASPPLIMAMAAASRQQGIDVVPRLEEQHYIDYAAAHPALNRATEQLGAAIYGATQEWFRERGITSVRMRRHTRAPENERGNLYRAWSVPGAGGLFQATNDYQHIEDDIPVERIFSIPVTGPGSPEEAEVVVMSQLGPSRRPDPKAKAPSPAKRAPRKATVPAGSANPSDGLSGVRRISTYGGPDATGLTQEQYNALFRYIGGGFGPANRTLRGQRRPGDSGDSGADVGVIDALMADSRTGEDVTVYRGLRTGTGIFGPRSSRPADLTGFEWTEEAFASTALNDSSAASFARGPLGGEGGILLRIRVPRGTGALDLRGGGMQEDELLLQRGLRFRVVGEGGTRRVMGGGEARVLDVEVIDAIPPAEQAARDRQVKVDRASSVHALVSEVDQLLTDGASDRALKARITSGAKVSNTPPDVRDRLLAAVGDEPAMRQVLADIRREEGLSPIGEAGAGARFDPKLHESIGGDIPLGAPVTVVKPGHRFDGAGVGPDGADGVTFPARVEAGEPPTTGEVPGRSGARKPSDIVGAERQMLAADVVKRYTVGRESVDDIAVSLAYNGDLSEADARRLVRDLLASAGHSEAPRSSDAPSAPGAEMSRLTAGLDLSADQGIVDDVSADLDRGRPREDIARDVRVEADRLRGRAAARGDDPREIEVENRIRAAYRSAFAAANSGGNRRSGLIPLADIRDRLSDLDRAEVDAALIRMAKSSSLDGPRVLLAPNESPRHRSARDNAAALTIRGYGSEGANHYLTIEDPSPRTPDPRSVREKARSDALFAFARRLEGQPDLTSGPSAREIEVENRIRAAYRAVQARKPGDWVSLADLRNELGESLNRHEVDDALRRLERQPDVNIVPESNQKALTQADRDSAVRIGDQAKHAITIGDPSPRPSPESRPSAPSVPTKATPARKAAKKVAPKVATSDITTALIDAGDDTSAISSILAPLNSSQLKDLARTYQIRGASKMRRDELVAALTERVRRGNLVTGVGETIAESAAKTQRAQARPPAAPVRIHDLFDADDDTIAAALKDVFEGRFGPYMTKVRVHVRRAGTRKIGNSPERTVGPSIGVSGKIFDADGREIGYFDRSIEPTDLHYPGGTIRREVWADHEVVQLGEGDYDQNPTKYHGKGFGGEFNRRAIEWYRASGVHGISQNDTNFYVWASQGFNFSGGIVPDHTVEDIRELIADLRAGRTKDRYDKPIPKALREAPDLEAQIAAAEALLARLARTQPGHPDYPTAYEISQLGRTRQRGKTAIWFGKRIPVSADEMILNPDEGEVIS